MEQVADAASAAALEVMREGLKQKRYVEKRDRERVRWDVPPASGQFWRVDTPVVAQGVISNLSGGLNYTVSNSSPSTSFTAASMR